MEINSMVPDVKAFLNYMKFRIDRSVKSRYGPAVQVYEFLTQNHDIVAKLVQMPDNGYKQSSEYGTIHWHLVCYQEGFGKGKTATLAMKHLFKLLSDFKKVPEEKNQIVNYMNENKAVNKATLHSKLGILRHDSIWITDRLKEGNVLKEVVVDGKSILYLPSASEKYIESTLFS